MRAGPLHLTGAALLCLALLAAHGKAQTLDTAAVTRAVLDEMRDTRAPGVAIAVVVGDEIVYERAFGVASVETREPVTTGTLFRIGSTTKMFTGLTTLLLESERSLDTKAPISRVVPGLAAPIGTLTLAQLLTHRAGLINLGAGMGAQDDEALGRRVREWDASMILGPPDDIYSYSSPGYWLAGHVIEKAAGKPYADVVTERVLRPLGMERSTFRPLQAMTFPFAQDHRVWPESVTVIRPFPNDVTTWASGSLFSSARELARFMVALMTDGRIDGRQVYPGVVAQALLTRHGETPAANCGYTFGLMRCADGGSVTVGHSGFRGGSGSIMTMAPERRVGVVVLSNRNGGIFGRTAIAVMQQLMRAGRTGDAAGAASTQTSPAPSAAQFAGLYAHRPDTLRVVARGSQLLLLRGSDTSVARIEAPNALAVLDAGGTVAARLQLVNGRQSVYLHDGIQAWRRVR